MLKSALNLVFWVLALISPALFASEHVAMGWNMWGLGSAHSKAPAFGFYLITFLIFIAIIFFAVKKPLMEFLALRSDQIRKTLDDSFNAQVSAEQRLTELKSRFATLPAEIESIKKRLHEQGERERQLVIEEGAKIASQIRADFSQSMAAEISRIKIELRREIVDAIIALLKKRFLAQRGEVEQVLMSAFYNDVKPSRWVEVYHA